MVEAANKQEIDIGFNLCVPEGNAASMVLSADQQITIIKKLHRLHKEGRILRFTSPLTAVLNDQRSPRYIGIKGGCTAGIAACSILPNGDVCPCPFFRIKAGNIHESDFREIWFNSKIFSALRDRKSFEEPCGSCDYLSYCGGCRARAMKVTGSLSGADVECLKGGLLK
jgi:radical SAM protein with 4Fe4S-binding SPASM domain